MADYPSNSNKSKAMDDENVAVEKRVEAIVDGPVKTRKRNFLKTAMVEIVREDIPRAVREKVIPTVKDAVYNIIIDTVASVLHVDNSRLRGTGGGGARVSYRDYYNQNRQQPPAPPRYATPGYDFDDIVFEDRGTAEAVLDQMFALLDRYGMVRVADLYGLSNISCRYTDNAYGWTDLRQAKVVPVNDGWIIDLPKAIPVK